MSQTECHSRDQSLCDSSAEVINKLFGTGTLVDDPSRVVRRGDGTGRVVPFESEI